MEADKEKQLQEILKHPLFADVVRKAAEKEVQKGERLKAGKELAELRASKPAIVEAYQREWSPKKALMLRAETTFKDQRSAWLKAEASLGSILGANEQRGRVLEAYLMKTAPVSLLAQIKILKENYERVRHSAVDDVSYGPEKQRADMAAIKKAIEEVKNRIYNGETED